jgi:hypothetical protein
MKFINVIFNADHPDPDRFDKLCEELARQGILDEADIYPCIRGAATIEASINASHKMLVRMAKDAKLEKVCIMEDDVLFPAKDGFNYFMALEPNRYDIYTAGTYGGYARQTESSNPCLIVPYPVGLHCYLIHSQFYDKFLSIDPTKHIDTALEGLGTFKLCYPMAAIQRPGWSSNNRKDVNFNLCLKKEDVYFGQEAYIFTYFPKFD